MSKFDPENKLNLNSSNLLVKTVAAPVLADRRPHIKVHSPLAAHIKALLAKYNSQCGVTQ